MRWAGHLLMMKIIELRYNGEQKTGKRSQNKVIKRFKHSLKDNPNEWRMDVRHPEELDLIVGTQEEWKAKCL